MEQNKEIYLDWISYLTALKISLEETYKKRAGGAPYLPELEKRLKEHSTETAGHIQKLKDVIQQNGGKLSVLKSLSGEIFGRVDVFITKPIKGTPAVNATADYFSEACEVYTLKSLLTVSETLGDRAGKETFVEILKDDERMMEWLDQNRDTIVKEVLLNE